MKTKCPELGLKGEWPEIESKCYGPCGLRLADKLRRSIFYTANPTVEVHVFRTNVCIYFVFVLTPLPVEWSAVQQYVVSS